MIPSRTHAGRLLAGAMVIAAILGLPWLGGCGGSTPDTPPATPVAAAPMDGERTDSAGPGSETGSDVRFVDVAAAAGVDLVAVQGGAEKDYILESIGTGVAVGDYDGDGDEDLYLLTAQTTEEWRAGRRPHANALYRNNGDGSFTDVAVEAGVALRAWSMGAYFVDYDNDGDKDLFVTTWGPNALYRNEGDGTFADVTAASGLAGGAGDWSASAAFSDLDADGDLDVYVTNYCEYDLIDPPFDGAKVVWKGIVVNRGPAGLVEQEDRLFRNNGDGTFSDISRASGVLDLAGPQYGLGVTMADFDADGDPDIYVANDSRPNHLWRNDGDLRFTDVSTLAGVATNEDAKEQAGMGADVADYDGDGRTDVVVTNFSHDWNTLYRNQGGMYFVDETFSAGFRDSYMKLAWGVKFFDYDNDGWLDLMVANGHLYPQVDANPHLNTSYDQPNSLYRNLGDGTFANRAEHSGPGLREVKSSRGLAVADFDRNGALDVIVTNIDSTPTLLRNEGTPHGWVSLRLVGTRSNRDAVGARAELEAGGRRQIREVNPFGSYLSQGSHTLHFGLGSEQNVDRVTIRWPSGQTDEIENLTPRRFYTVTEGQGISATAEPGSD